MAFSVSSASRLRPETIRTVGLLRLLSWLSSSPHNGPRNRGKKKSAAAICGSNRCETTIHDSSQACRTSTKIQSISELRLVSTVIVPLPAASWHSKQLSPAPFLFAGRLAPPSEPAKFVLSAAAPHALHRAVLLVLVTRACARAAAGAPPPAPHRIHRTQLSHFLLDLFLRCLIYRSAQPEHASASYGRTTGHCSSSSPHPPPSSIYTHSQLLSFFACRQPPTATQTSLRWPACSCAWPPSANCPTNGVLSPHFLLPIRIEPTALTLADCARGSPRLHHHLY